MRLFAAQLADAQLLVGDAGRAVGQMDDAAAGKAVCFQHMLHHFVVGVGVGPQALAVLQAPVDDQAAHAAAVPGRGQAVQGAIGAVVQPVPALDGLISRVFAQDEREDGFQLAVDDTDEQPVGEDVLLDQLPRGIVVSPLGGVAILRHERPGTGVNVHDLI